MTHPHVKPQEKELRGMLWAAKWQQHGSREHLLRESGLPMLFKTQRQCKAWIKEKYGYIATRKDLRTAPHNWRMPKPVNVLVFECTHLKALRKDTTHADKEAALQTSGGG